MPLVSNLTMTSVARPAGSAGLDQLDRAHTRADHRDCLCGSVTVMGLCRFPCFFVLSEDAQSASTPVSKLNLADDKIGDSPIK